MNCQKSKNHSHTCVRDHKTLSIQLPWVRVSITFLRLWIEIQPKAGSPCLPSLCRACYFVVVKACGEWMFLPFYKMILFPKCLHSWWQNRLSPDGHRKTPWGSQARVKSGPNWRRPRLLKRTWPHWNKQLTNRTRTQTWELDRGQHWHCLHLSKSAIPPTGCHRWLP